jgi:hypothetical protein
LGERQVGVGDRLGVDGAGSAAVGDLLPVGPGEYPLARQHLGRPQSGLDAVAEGARAGAADRELVGLDFESLPRERQRDIAFAIVRREVGIMAVSALVIFLLALRAATTS